MARFEPGRVATPTHRNPVWMLAGLLLVLLSALGGVVLISSRDERHGALVASRDLSPGHVVERSDFRTVELAVDGAAATISPEAVGELVGLRVVGPIPGGTVVHPALFSAVTPLGPGEMEVGAALDPGQFPRSALTIGGPVELLVTAASADGVAESGQLAESPAAGDPTGAAAPGAAGLVPAQSLGTGSVTAVEERATGELLVTVRVARDVGLLAAEAARRDRLTLAIVSGGS